MTEERMLYRSTRGFQHAMYSGLCTKCKEVFYTQPGALGRFCSQSCSNSGERNGNWTGGRYKGRDGYVLISGNLKHPRRKRSGQIHEHILVMEKHLGRFLKKGESVHHKNGIKDDNELKNLELWVRPQPTGQRVTDLAKWVITTYPELIKRLKLKEKINEKDKK